MAVHVAIVTAPYDRLILDGAKTVECRLTRTAREPFGCVTPGERIYFKRSGGPFFATAVVDRVWTTDNVGAYGVDRLRERFNAQIHGAGAWWGSQHAARYATLVWLREVEPTTQRPAYRTQKMRAWYVLDDAADPRRVDGGRSSNAHAARRVFEVELTRGNLTQNHVRVRDVIERFPADALGGRTKAHAGRAIKLMLVDGPTIETDIVEHNRLIRWRGWGGWFERHGLRAGHRVRFVPLGRRRFRVEPVGG